MTFLVDGTNGGTFPSWTTATRPASPAVGQMGYNTTTGKFDQYTAAGWTSVSTQTTGQTLQVVSATGTALVSILGGPTSTGFSASITPTAATSKVLVLFNGRFYTTSGAEIKASIYRGGSAIQGNYLCYNSSGSIAAAQQILVLDSPATTSSTTYTLYLTGINNNAVLNPNGAADGPYSFTLMEIAA